jgi:hypothetical protein
LSDFGRAKVLGEEGYSCFNAAACQLFNSRFVRYATELLAGCAPYMAPELFPEDDVDVDKLFSKCSDIYAFGMFAFEVRNYQE